MSSTFGSLNIGYSGLVAQKLGLDTTGQNISNASTPGYHRQSVSLTSASGSNGALYARSDGTGDGVNAGNPQRAVDQFLQKQSLNANASNAQLSGQADTLSDIENTLGEPSTTGLQAGLSGF